jgi:hypothetical protein
VSVQRLRMHRICAQVHGGTGTCVSVRSAVCSLRPRRRPHATCKCSRQQQTCWHACVPPAAARHTCLRPGAACP